jgi:outer membrane protein assembly factor BamA
MYGGKFTNVVGKWNLELDADLKAPNYVNNFFGWGNESVFDKNIVEQPGIDVDHAIDYYRVRFRQITLEAKLARRFKQGFFFGIGPQLQNLELEDTDGKDRFINQYEPLLEKDNYFGGVTYTFGLDKRKIKGMTTRGIYLEQTSRIMKGFSAPNFASHNLMVSFYQSFKLPATVTFALRAGGGINTGTYEFYQAQILDGKTEVRGFRKTRFYGDKRFYVNNEVRLKLANLRSYLFPAHLGVLGFYDIGRVWYKDENGTDPSALSGNSSKWHHGIGGGLWLTPFNMATISTEIGHSVEGTLFYFRLGFLF